MFKRNSIAVGVVATALALGSASPAVADAHGNASCIGFEASGIAPQGSSDEFPGGPAELQAFLHDTFGHPTGAIVSGAAHEHLGSHEACDAGE
jgi:hypothetical protein